MRLLAYALLLWTQSAIAPSAVITGRVLTKDGTPAAGIRIVALEDRQADAPAVVAVTNSAEDGTYRLENVPPGRHRIAAGFLETPTFHPGVPAADQATLVVIERGSNVNLGDFRLVRSTGVTIRGHVVRPPGPGVAVTDSLTVTISDSTAIGIGSAQVGKDGSFSFQRVPPGNYTASLQPARRSEPTSFVVGDHDVDVFLTAPVNYAGRVTVDDGTALPRIDDSQPPQITLNANPTAPVKAGGVFQFDPASGSFTVGIRELPFGYYVRSITYGARNLLEENLTVSKAPTADVSIVLTKTRPKTAPAGVLVKGRLTDIPQGIGLGAFAVGMVGGPEDRSATSDVQPDGTFEFQDVPPGLYGVRAIVWQGGTLSLHGPGESLTVSTKGVNDLKVPIVLRLEVSGRITLINAMGQPLPRLPFGLAVEFSRLGDNSVVNAPFEVRAVVRSGGQFGVISLVSGEYSVRLHGIPRESLKSLTAGPMDLLKVPLNVDSALAAGISLVAVVEETPN